MPRPFHIIFSVAAALLGVLVVGLPAAPPQETGANAVKKKQIVSTQKPAAALISKQDPPKLTPRVLDQITPDNAFILISLSKQRAWLMLQNEIAVDSPVSTGKKARQTPPGKFKITQKNKDHRSNLYGSFVDKKGRTVRSGVSSRIDSAPSGTRFVGSPMLYFQRLTNDGIGLHVGVLPGYPASHGCIRLPDEIARIFFEKTKLGTRVEIVN